jgi:hypothetical protein
MFSFRLISALTFVRLPLVAEAETMAEYPAKIEFK